MADDHGHGEEKKKGGQEFKPNLKDNQKRKLEGYKSRIGNSGLIASLYEQALTHYNNSAEAFSKKDSGYVKQLAPVVGGLKGFYEKAKDDLGSMKYYLSPGYDARMLREAHSYIKKMERNIKKILKYSVKQSKREKKEAMGSMKAYIPQAK